MKVQASLLGLQTRNRFNTLKPQSHQNDVLRKQFPRPNPPQFQACINKPLNSQIIFFLTFTLNLSNYLRIIIIIFIIQVSFGQHFIIMGTKLLILYNLFFFFMIIHVQFLKSFIFQYFFFSHFAHEKYWRRNEIKPYIRTMILSHIQ